MLVAQQCCHFSFLSTYNLATKFQSWSVLLLKKSWQYFILLIQHKQLINNNWISWHIRHWWRKLYIAMYLSRAIGTDHVWEIVFFYILLHVSCPARIFTTCWKLVISYLLLALRHCRPASIKLNKLHIINLILLLLCTGLATLKCITNTTPTGLKFRTCFIFLDHVGRICE